MCPNYHVTNIPMSLFLLYCHGLFSCSASSSQVLLLPAMEEHPADWKHAVQSRVFWQGKKCNRPLKPGHSPSPPRPSLSELKCIQQPPPPFHSSAVTCLTWKKRHNIGLRLICGFVCQLLSIVTARTIQAVSRRVYLIGFPSWPQPVTMCFHWSVFPDHSAPMALTGPS